MTTTTILLEDRSFSCTLRFSARRRSVQIRVPRPDCLELAAPAGMSWPKIRELVETKRVWILRQVRRLEAVAANPANASLTHGATILYRGQPHTLLLLADAAGRPTVTYSACQIAVHLPELVGEDNDPTVWHSLKNGIWIRPSSSYWNEHGTGRRRLVCSRSAFPCATRKPAGEVAHPGEPSASTGASSWRRRQCWTTWSSTSCATCCIRTIRPPTGGKSPAGFPTAATNGAG